MPEEVRLWNISEGDKLKEIKSTSLDYESRLESWIEKDISILDPNLLVIGRQVKTDFNGIIDLLCLNPDGDTIIIELKKDKTSREITSQALDYASWVRNLSNNKIVSISEKYFGNSTNLEEAYIIKFGKDLPEILNENHSILIVGSNIDSSSERIINYLSEVYGVNINAATFQYFMNENNEEFLTRIFLIELDKAKYQNRTKSSSKRRRNLTFEELYEITKQNNIGDLYHYFVSQLSKIFKKHTTASSIAFTADFNGSQKAIFSLIPNKSSEIDGLHFQLYFNRICEVLNYEKDEALKLLPSKYEDWIYYENAGPDFSGYSGYFRKKEEIDKFISGINNTL